MLGKDTALHHITSIKRKTGLTASVLLSMKDSRRRLNLLTRLLMIIRIPANYTMELLTVLLRNAYMETPE